MQTEISPELDITLQINTSAPQFSETDIFDRQINLQDYRGKKILISFFRHAMCPFCNVRVHRLQKQHEILKANGLEMIFFFESSKETLLNNSFHRNVSPIPLIADPTKKIYSSYGVPESENAGPMRNAASILPKMIQAKLSGVPFGAKQGTESIYTLPAEFLIDEKGIIKKLHYAKSLTDRMSMDIINKFVNDKQ